MSKSPIRTERKTSIKNSAGRLTAAILSAMLQVAWMTILALFLNRYYTWISLVSTLIAILVVLKIYGTSDNANMKMPWMIVILAFPILGLIIYGIFGRSIVTKKVKAKFNTIEQTYKKCLSQNMDTFREIEESDIRTANQFRYLYNIEGFPVYKNTDVIYYSDASVAFETQLTALASAKEFIFMEYHAIEDEYSFNRLKQILVERASAGVEVRMFYDDVGSIFFLNKAFIKEMRENGIECRVFNPIKAAFNMFMNNRDHRKITVIDGKIGFTGGYNLADEYFNVTHPYGEWKDTGIKLTGDAVKSLTVSFLSMWNSIKKTDETEDDYIHYISASTNNYVSNVNSQYICPYADSPLNETRVAENVYLNLIKNAKHYLYITTPYLLITDEMTRELGLAAMRGVKIRIVTPGIPDKKITYSLTRSYYPDLVRYGIEIFEYTPGFLHAKQWVCDDEISIVGTINMDFRSLFLHFENAVLIYGKATASEVKKDFEDTFEKSANVTSKYTERPKTLKLSQCILRIVAPLF